MSRKNKALDVASTQGIQKTSAANRKSLVKLIQSIDESVKPFLAGTALILIFEILYWLNWPWKNWISRLIDRLSVIKEGRS